MARLLIQLWQLLLRNNPCSARLSTSSSTTMMLPRSIVALLVFVITVHCNTDDDENWKHLSDKRAARGTGNDHLCATAPNKNLCLPKSYSKFELPHTDSVNVVEIGIDIIDVLRINDKVRKSGLSSSY